MKGIQVAVGPWNGRPAAALLRDGVLDDLLVAGGDDSLEPGTILRGVAERPAKGQGGIFVRLPEGKRGFLRQIKGISPGDTLLVQVVSHAEPGKAVPLTTKVLFKSRYAIVTPDAPGRNVSRAIRDDELRDELTVLAAETELPEGAGVILRSACSEATEEEIAADLDATAELARAVLSDAGQGAELLLDAPDPQLLAWRDWPRPDALDEGPEAFEVSGAADQIAALGTARVDLGQGAHMIVEATRALVAVDVNTGADGSPAAGLKANIAAARALPRALRLRGLGGQIVVDFAPAPKKDRRQIETSLRAAFKACPVETALAGWTTLGLFELQRKRERAPLAARLGLS